MENSNENFTKDYLNGRLDIIKNKKLALMSRSNKNQLQVVELNGKIKQIQEKIDDAYEIFSPKPRKSGFTKTEMAVLAQKQIELLEKNKKLRRDIRLLDMERETIEKCIVLIENGQVISKSADDMNCIEHYFNDTEESIKGMRYQIVEGLEELSTSMKHSVKNLKNYQEIQENIDSYKNNMLHLINNTIPQSQDKTLENLCEELINIINRDNSDIIATLYEGDVDNISNFSTDIIYRIISCVLTNITVVWKKNILLRISALDNYCVVVFETDATAPIAMKNIVNYRVNNDYSLLTVKDLINISNGEFTQNISNTKIQYIFKIRK